MRYAIFDCLLICSVFCYQRRPLYCPQGWKSSLRSCHWQPFPLKEDVTADYELDHVEYCRQHSTLSAHLSRMRHLRERFGHQPRILSLHQAAMCARTSWRLSKRRACEHRVSSLLSDPWKPSQSRSPQESSSGGPLGADEALVSLGQPIFRASASCR